VTTGVAGSSYIGGFGRSWVSQRAELAGEGRGRLSSEVNAGARLSRTGDWVVICRTGNMKIGAFGHHQVKVRGFSIALGEIESALWVGGVAGTWWWGLGRMLRG